MKKFGKVALLIALIGTVYCFTGWSCKRGGKYEGEGAQGSEEFALEPLEEVKDPENAVRFAVVYSSNLNAEYDACG